MFTILRPDDLLLHWPIIQPMLQKWIEVEPNGEYTTKDLLEEGMGGKRDFWIIFSTEGGKFNIDCVLSTYMTSTPLKKIWFWHLAIGEGLLKSMEEVHRVFRREAAYEGCNAIQMVARRGFGKAMAPYGYQQLSSIFEYRITEKEVPDGGLLHQHQHAGNVDGSVADQHERVH
jgi:hypothetical protein